MLCYDLICEDVSPDVFFQFTLSIMYSYARGAKLVAQMSRLYVETRCSLRCVEFCSWSLYALVTILLFARATTGII